MDYFLKDNHQTCGNSLEYGSPMNSTRVCTKATKHAHGHNQHNSGRLIPLLEDRDTREQSSAKGLTTNSLPETPVKVANHTLPSLQNVALVEERAYLH